MHVDRTAAGITARLRQTGVGRFGAAAFLSVWLTGWAAGECAATFALARMVQSAVQGDLGAGDGGQFDFGAGLGGSLFLLVWLTLWTIGGFVAARELLRLIWNRQTFVISSAGLTRINQIGPFRSRRQFGRGEPFRLFSRRSGRSLMIEQAGKSTELTRLGTAEERDELRKLIDGELRLEPAREDVGAEVVSPVPPPGWQTQIDPSPDCIARQLRSLDQTWDEPPAGCFS